MGLPKRRRLRAPGIPEFVGIGLVLALVTSAVVWIADARRGDWSATLGRVVEGSILATHMNSPDYARKVDIVYEYAVDGVQYRGRSIGYWPSAWSPNALAPDQLDQLTQSQRPLTVLYDPKHPVNSDLHTARGAQSTGLRLTTVITLVLSVVYVFRIYPAWRRRHYSKTAYEKYRCAYTA